MNALEKNDENEKIFIADDFMCNIRYSGYSGTRSQRQYDESTETTGSGCHFLAICK